MCDEMKWFFGLKGISCFNCGRVGHHGSDCDRPNCDMLLRDQTLLTRELERAEAKSLEDELEEQRQKSRDNEKNRKRGRDRDAKDDFRNRAKSQPAASRFSRPQSQNSNYGRIDGSSHSHGARRIKTTSDSTGRPFGNSSSGRGRRNISGSNRGHR